jgi:hypothetical protein
MPTQAILFFTKLWRNRASAVGIRAVCPIFAFPFFFLLFIISCQSSRQERPSYVKWDRLAAARRIAGFLVYGCGEYFG